jgi:competence protein ComGC
MKSSSSMYEFGSGARSVSAFTLAEMMTALAIFSLVVMAMVSLQLFGFKMNAVAQSKLKSTGSSLKILDRVRGQVMGAYSVSVGNGNQTSFTTTGSTGNALQVYPGTNTGSYLRFYVATNTSCLYELNSTSNTLLLLASNITNKQPFATVNFQGSVSSSSQEHYAIRMILQFAQLDYTLPVNAYDYYTLETEMTPRTQ